MSSIAVLLATYNRREKTLACLQRLYAQVLPEGCSLDVFLTDDASADGTREAVTAQYPQVHLYSGNGSFFWAGGMRHTWRQALSSKADFYLLLNDDTMLEPHAISILVETSLRSDPAALCIGTTCNDAGEVSYGGRALKGSKVWKSAPVFSEEEAVACDFGNANILWVPAAVVKTIGILSEGFTHGLADYDYTLKAKKAGFQVLVPPGCLGHCVDDHGKNWKPAGSSFKERLAYLHSPKGLAYSEYLGFIRTHFPLSYPSAFCKLWLKTFFPFLWDTLKR